MDFYASASIFYIWQYGYRLEEDVSILEDGAGQCQLNSCKRYQRAVRNRSYAAGLAAALYLWNVMDALIADGYGNPEVSKGSRRAQYEKIDYSLTAVPDYAGNMQYKGGLRLRF